MMRVWDFSKKKPKEILASEDFLSNREKGRVLALGYFDGVHKGHISIIQAACEEAKKRGVLSALHTFSTVPTSKKKDIQSAICLTTEKEKECLLQAAGMEEILLFPFDEEMKNMPPEAFLEKHVRDIAGAVSVVVGEDYCFGKDRIGDIDFLVKWCRENQIELKVVSPVLENGAAISSTRIRQTLSEGAVEEANSLLGYVVSYEGVVEKGFQIGRTLSFPTANMCIDKEKLVPRYGVYASFFYVDGKFYKSISNIGLRPTLERKERTPVVETMIYGENLDLYGKTVRVFLLSFVRPEKKFASLEDLKEAVHQDMKTVEHHHDIGYDSFRICDMINIYN